MAASAAPLKIFARIQEFDYRRRRGDREFTEGWISWVPQCPLWLSFLRAPSKLSPAPRARRRSTRDGSVPRTAAHASDIPQSPRADARPLHALLDVRGQFVLPPNVFQPNIVLVQRGNFRLQIAAQQSHQEAHFALGPLLPVFFGERIERQRGNMNARRRLHRRTHGC